MGGFFFKTAVGTKGLKSSSLLWDGWGAGKETKEMFFGEESQRFFTGTEW